MTFFAATRHEGWLIEHIEMLRNTFDEITITHGDELGIVGMHLKMDHDKKCAILTQPKWEKKVLKEFKVEKKAPSPVLANLMATGSEEIYVTQLTDDV
jgi:hypothetical protein